MIDGGEEKEGEKKVPETEAEEESTSKEEAESPQPEVETEKKEEKVVEEPTGAEVEAEVISKAKNWLIILLLLIIIGTFGTYMLWRSGVDDLKEDNTYLIVVQEKGIAKAGSVYDLSLNKAEIINVGVLPPVTDEKEFFNDAMVQSGRKIDRLIIIRVETVSKLSTEPFLEYKGKQIPSQDVPGYIIGSLHDEFLRGDDPDWKFRANLLSVWVEVYDNKITDATYGSQLYNTIFEDYRKRNIIVYPRNTALTILKYVPVERLLL